MSVLVKGMEKPEHCGYCRFRYDGICHALQKTQYSMDECPLAGIDDVPDICVGDTISRQAAIDAILTEVDEIDMPNVESRWWNMGMMRASKILEHLPSAQPEIVRCKDCKHLLPNDRIAPNWWRICDIWRTGVDENEYCSHAERKEE